VKQAQVWMAVVVVVLTAILPSLGFAQPYYDPTPTAQAGPARNLLRGLPVQVVVRVAGPYVYMYGDFKTNAEHYVTINGGSIDNMQFANLVEVVIGDFQPESQQGISVSNGRLAIATSALTNSTTGIVRLTVRGQVIHSVQFDGRDIARGITIAYGKGAQAQLPYANGYGQGYGYPQAYTPGGVALDATGQAGVYVNGQWVQPGAQPYGNAMPYAGPVQQAYPQGGVAYSATPGAVVYAPNGQLVPSGASNPYNYNGYAGAPQGNGNVVIYNQQFPRAEKAIRRALEPAIRRLALGR